MSGNTVKEDQEIRKFGKGEQKRLQGNDRKHGKRRKGNTII